AGISAPINDHVPELMYAHDVPCAGTAATAEPVSCDAVATTGTGFNPVSAATDARSGLSTVPGCTMLPKIFEGRLNASTNSNAQPRVAGLSICVVLALLNSFTLTPVNQK